MGYGCVHCVVMGCAFVVVFMCTWTVGDITGGCQVCGGLMCARCFCVSFALVSVIWECPGVGVRGDRIGLSFVIG